MHLVQQCCWCCALHFASTFLFLVDCCDGSTTISLVLLVHPPFFLAYGLLLLLVAGHLVPCSLLTVIWWPGYGTFLTCGAQQNTALLAARSRSNDILHQHDVILGSCYKSGSESVHSKSVLLCTRTIMPLVDQQHYSSPLLLLLEQQQQKYNAGEDQD